MANLFQFDSYKEYLKAILGANARQRGFQAQMARAAQCQASYLNQALHTKVELTPDHVARIAKFLQLDPVETEYLLNLLHLSRATSPELKGLLLTRLRELSETSLSVSARIGKPADASTMHQYYSSWIWMAVHMALDTEGLRTPLALAKRFGITAQKARMTLDELRYMGLAQEQDGKWSTTKEEVHLAANEFMNGVSHRNWRDRAILDVERDRAESVHYTSVFTMDPNDAVALRKTVLQFISSTRAFIKPSKPKEVYCMLLNFFVV